MLLVTQNTFLLHGLHETSRIYLFFYLVSTAPNLEHSAALLHSQIITIDNHMVCIYLTIPVVSVVLQCVTKGEQSIYISVDFSY